MTACRGALERDADALVERTEALRAELAATLEDFDGVNSVTCALREEVTDEVGKGVGVAGGCVGVTSDFSSKPATMQLFIVHCIL